MNEELWFTRVLNHAFAGPVTASLRALHFSPVHPHHPIPNHVAMEIFVALVLMVFSAVLARSLSVEEPGSWQHIVELVWGFVDEQAEEVIGHEGHQFVKFCFTLLVFILLCNLLGLIPGFESPTASLTVPLGCALVAFFYYHWAGLKRQKLHYFKQFIGPIPFLFFLMIPIELISHAARVLSLTVRLYANMFAGDLVITVMLALFPLSGIIFLGLHTFVALLQAYIFMLLAMVYLSGAVAEEH